MRVFTQNEAITSILRCTKEYRKVYDRMICTNIDGP